LDRGGGERDNIGNEESLCCGKSDEEEEPLAVAITTCDRLEWCNGGGDDTF
jgi:hypothetical protein